MKTSLSLIVLIFLGSLVFAQESQTAKQDYVAKILDVADNLSRIASSNRYGEGVENPDKSTREKINREVERIKEPEQLVILARTCWVILGSENADDVSYDRVFLTAFWHCVTLLSDDTSDKSVAALRKLYTLSNTQAGYRRWFQEAIAHQRAKRAGAKKRRGTQ